MFAKSELPAGLPEIRIPDNGKRERETVITVEGTPVSDLHKCGKKIREVLSYTMLFRSLRGLMECLSTVDSKHRDRFIFADTSHNDPPLIVVQFET